MSNEHFVKDSSKDCPDIGHGNVTKLFVGEDVKSKMLEESYIHDVDTAWC